MTTKKQRRERVELKNAEKKAADRAFSLAQLKVAQYNRLDAETKTKIKARRFSEEVLKEDIRRAWDQGCSVEPRFGWTAKQINRIEKLVARESYGAMLNYSMYSVMAKPCVRTETMFFSFSNSGSS